MSPDEQSRLRWSEYYRVVADRPPRELYRLAVTRFGQAGSSPGLAVDLGCGTGIETEDLLRRGWQVVAIDQQAEAIEQTLARVPAEYRDRLETRLASLEAIEIPTADFIWAGLSLPFCPPEHFPAMWAKLVSALRPGGRFAGDLFGVRHAWADRAQMTFHTVDQVKALCQSLILEYFIEEEGERPTALEGLQHWHGISVIARKP